MKTLWRLISGGPFPRRRCGQEGVPTTAKELELPELTGRSFRRSVETLPHTEGAPLKIQQQVVGHTKATTTLLYAEPGIEDRREALGKIQSRLLPGCNWSCNEDRRSN